MWYKLASAEIAFNKLVDEISSNKIRKMVLDKNGVFPSENELAILKKRFNNLCAKKFGTLWDYRKDNMERNIEKIVDKALSTFKV